MLRKHFYVPALLLGALLAGCNADAAREVQINAYLTHAQALCMTLMKNSLEAPTALEAAQKYMSDQHLNLPSLRSEAAASMKESFKLKSKYAGRMQQLKETRDMVIQRYPHLNENAELKKLLVLLGPAE